MEVSQLSRDILPVIDGMPKKIERNAEVWMAGTYGSVTFERINENLCRAYGSFYKDGLTLKVEGEGATEDEAIRNLRLNACGKVVRMMNQIATIWMAELSEQGAGPQP